MNWLNFEAEVGVAEELENVQHLKDCTICRNGENSLYFCQHLVLISCRCGSHQKGSMCVCETLTIMEECQSKVFPENLLVVVVLVN